MKTIFVGGGRGCREILEMVVNKRLATLSPEVLAVVDPQFDAPGMVFARSHGDRISNHQFRGKGVAFGSGGLHRETVHPQGAAQPGSKSPFSLRRGECLCS